MQPNFMRLSLIVMAFGLATACSPTVASRGAAIDPDKLAEVKTGSSREDVANLLGTPTIISTYDDKIWYYIGRKTEQYSFLDPEVKGNEAVEVRFDDQGSVVEVKKLDVAAAREITPNPDRTPTYGNDNTLIQQLIGNLSRPIPGRGTNRGQ